MVSTAANTGIKSAERVLDIFEALADDERRACSQADLAKRLGIPKSSLHGLLRVLAGRGYVDFDGASRTYHLGPRVLGLASSYLADFDFYRAARPVMAALAHLTGETITLDVPQGSSMTTLAREPGRHPIRVVTGLGQPFASHATASGKVILASLPDEQLGEYYPEPELPPLTDATIRTVEQLRTELAQVRRLEVAYAHGEINDGVEAVAVPVVGPERRVVAALDALLPVHRASPEYLRRITRVMQAGARIVSARLGGPSAAVGRAVDPETYLEQVWGSNGMQKGAV